MSVIYIDEYPCNMDPNCGIRAFCLMIQFCCMVFDNPNNCYYIENLQITPPCDETQEDCDGVSGAR